MGCEGVCVGGGGEVCMCVAGEGREVCVDPFLLHDHVIIY